MLLLLILCPYLYGDVIKIYNENKSKIHDGVNRIDDYLFVQSTIKASNSTRDFEDTMNAMLEVQQYLKAFYTKPIQIKSNINFDKKSPLYNKLIHDIEISYKNQPFNLSSTRSHVLVNRKINDNDYRYLIALPYNPDLIKKSTSVNIGMNEWIKALKKAENDCNDDEKKLSVFMLNLGDIETAISWQKEELEYSIDLTNFPLHDDSTEKTEFSGNYKQIEQLATKYKNDKKNFATFAIFAYSIPAIDDFNNKLTSLESSLQELSSVVSSKTSEEYIKYLQMLAHALKQKNSDTLRIENNKISSYLLLLATGHIRPNKSLNEKFPAEYQQALALFSKGLKLNTIISLLDQSINKAPASAAPYKLIGAALIAQKKYLRASLYLIQSIQLDNENGETKANLAVCYQKLNLNHLSQNMAWSSLISDKQTKWSKKTAISIIKE